MFGFLTRLITWVVAMYILLAGTFNSNYIGLDIPFINDYIVINNSNIEPTKIKNNLKHKEYHLYNKLSYGQKNLYDTLLSKSIDILEGNTNDTTIYLTLEDLGFKKDVENEVDLENKWNDYFENDFKRYQVVDALESDYGYYMWWYGGPYYYGSVIVLPSITNKDPSKTIVGIYLYSTNSNNSLYLMDSLISSARSAYNNAKDVAKSVEGLSDIEKMDYFKEYLLSTSVYDYEAFDASKEKEEIGLDEEHYKKYKNSYTFINIFDDNPETKVVCSGYAESFLLLCDLANIENCYYMSGMTSGRHAWNKYYSDGNIYLIDITNSSDDSIGRKDDLYMAQINDEDTYSFNIHGQVITYKEDVFE